MVNKKWTPVDSFVTEYGFRFNKTFLYQPGSGEATMIKTGDGLDLDDLRALIKTIEHHELQIRIDAPIFVFSPDEPGEEAEAPEEEPEIEAPVDEPTIEQPDQDEVAQAIDPEQEEPPEIIEIQEKPIEELIPA